MNMQPTIEEIKQAVAWQLAEINQNTVALFDEVKDDELKENYTLNFFPDELPLKITEELGKLANIQKDLFYLDRDKLHITLVGEIDAKSDSQRLIGIVDSWLSQNNLGFEMNGFASNKSTASILAYPTFDLHGFRELVRTGMGISGTDYTIHLSVYEYIGWINFVRYTNLPNEEFLKYLKKGKDIDFGILNTGKIKLLKNKSRLLKDGKYEIVHEF